MRLPLPVPRQYSLRMNDPYLHTRLQKFNQTTFYFDSSSETRGHNSKIFRKKNFFVELERNQKYADLDIMSCGSGAREESHTVRL